MKLKKLFALLLCAAMLLSVLPMGTLAGLLSDDDGGFLTVDDGTGSTDTGDDGGFLTVDDGTGSTDTGDNGGYLTVDDGTGSTDTGDGGYLTVDGDGDGDNDDDLPWQATTPGATQVYICEWCGWADGYHADDCPSHVDEEQPAEPAEPSDDEPEEPKPDKSEVRAYAAAANSFADIFEALLAAETLEEYEAILNELDDEQQTLFFDLLDDDELEALAEVEAELAYTAVTEYQPVATQVLTEEARAEAYFSAYAMALAAVEEANGQDDGTESTVTGGVFDYAPPFTTAGPLIDYDALDLDDEDEDDGQYGWYSSAFDVSTFGVSTLADGDDDDDTSGSGSTGKTGGLTLDKKVTVDDNGKYTITLEAYATGQSVTTYQKEGVDIVLMLDLSQYMWRAETTTTTTTKDVYKQVESSTTLSTLYDGSISGIKYYYKVGEAYYNVTITRTESSGGGGDSRPKAPPQQYSYSITYSNDIKIVDSKGGNTQLQRAGDNNSSVTLYTYAGQTTETTTTTTYQTNDDTKLKALKNAVNSFIGKVNEQAPASRIAIVTYADDAKVETSERGNNHVAADNAKAAEDALVTVDADGKAALENIVNGLTIQDGNSNSHYAAADAVKIFQSVDEDSEYYKRSRVAILFSAGIPGNGWAADDDDKKALTTGNSIAQATMTLAYILKSEQGISVTDPGGNVDGGASWSNFSDDGELKNTEFTGCGATVYCVGLDIPTSGDPAKVDMKVSPYKSGALANEYFWRTSSHRLDGTHITSPTDLGTNGQTVFDNRLSGTSYDSLYYFYPDELTRNQVDGYYLTTNSGSAEDLAKLSNIFNGLAGSATTSGGASIELGTNAVIKDIMSPQFQLPEGTEANDIKVKTYAYKGGDMAIDSSWEKNSTTMGATATVAEVDGNDVVSVTGFDFSANWCGEKKDGDNTSYHGNKLVISFEVEPKAGFLGGNNVPTNDAASGVYKDSTEPTPLQPFPQPEANVPIGTVSNPQIDTNVYLGGYYGDSLTGQEIKDNTTIKIGGTTLDLDPGAKNYGLDASMTKYVDVTVTITDEKGAVFTDIDPLTDDVTYKVIVTIKPEDSDVHANAVGTPNSADGIKSEATNTVRVFKPELTYKDSEVWYGDTAPTDYADNLTRTRWVHCGSDGEVDKVAVDDATSNNTKDTDIKMLDSTIPTLTITYTTPDDAITGEEGNKKINTPNDIPVNVTVTIEYEGKNPWDITQYIGFKHECTIEGCDAPSNGKFWLHVNTCSLTISKTWQSYDATYYQDAVFTVTGDSGYSLKVVAPTPTSNNGNYASTITITGLKVGTYTVTEDTNWAWRYDSECTNNSATLGKDSQSATISFTNTLKNEGGDKWLDFTINKKNVFGETESTEGSGNS